MSESRSAVSSERPEQSVVTWTRDFVRKCLPRIALWNGNQNTCDKTFTLPSEFQFKNSPVLESGPSRRST